MRLVMRPDQLIKLMRNEQTCKTAVCLARVIPWVDKVAMHAALQAPKKRKPDRVEAPSCMDAPAGIEKSF